MAKIKKKHSKVMSEVTMMCRNRDGNPAMKGKIYCAECMEQIDKEYDEGIAQAYEPSEV